MPVSAVVFDWYATLAKTPRRGRACSTASTTCATAGTSTCSPTSPPRSSSSAETVFVGDNWHDDIVGAGKAGITPVHIVRAGTCDIDDTPMSRARAASVAS